MQLVVELAAFLLQAGALVLEGGILLPRDLELLLQLLQRLFAFLDLAGAGEEAGGTALHAAAGHGAAGVHHVALQRHQAELIPSGPLDGNARGQVLGHHGAPKEIVDHALILRVKLHQLRRQAHTARHGQHVPLLLGEGAAAHGGDGEEGCPAEAVRAQILDHALGVLVPVHHDVLKGAAQHHVHGALQAGGHVDQIGHHAVHAGAVALPAGLHQHLLDGVVVALVVPLHLPQELQPGITLLLFVLHPHHAVLQGGGLVAQGLDPLLHLRRLLIQLALAGVLTVQDLLGGLHVGVQGLGAALFPLPVGLHGLQLVLQRRLHGAEAGTLGTHVAQAVHGLDDLLLGVLGGFLQVGKVRLRGFKLALTGGQRGRGLRQRGGLLFDLRAHLLDLPANALAALLGGSLLGLDAVPLPFARGDALAHDLHSALGGFHLADQLLHGFALFAAGVLQLVQLFLGLVPQGALFLQLPVGLEDGFAQGLHGLLELLDAGLVALGAHQKHVQIQALQLVPEGQVFPRLFALFLEGAHPVLQFGQDVLHAVQVLLSALDALLGVQLPGLVLDDARGLLEHLAAILAFGGQDLVDAALTDQGIAVLADAGVPEQVHDVPQTAGRAVDLVLAVAVAIHPAGDGNLGKVNGEGVVLVLKDQRHLAVGEAAAALGAIEDDVLHLRAAQALGTLLAQHPAHRVGDVALAAAVGTHHAGDAVLKGDLHVVREGLEAVEDEFLQSQFIDSLRSFE